MLEYITNGVGKSPSVYLNKVTFDFGLDRQLGILTCVTDFMSEMCHPTPSSASKHRIIGFSITLGFKCCLC